MVCNCLIFIPGILFYFLFLALALNWFAKSIYLELHPMGNMNSCGAEILVYRSMICKNLISDKLVVKELLDMV